MQTQTVPPNFPDEIRRSIKLATLSYTKPQAILIAFQLDKTSWLGVFGDPDNGAYEWFDTGWGKFEHSNSGFGGPLAALRDILNLTEDV